MEWMDKRSLEGAVCPHCNELNMVGSEINCVSVKCMVCSLTFIVTAEAKTLFTTNKI